MNPVLKKIFQLIKSQEREIQIASLKVLAELEIRDRTAIKLLGETLNKTADSSIKEIILEIPIRVRAGEFLPHLIPCLNDHSAWLESMASIIVDELGSWIEYPKQHLAYSFNCPSSLASRTRQTG